ncbi:MAG TPA: exo-beta-N-acetylmuramidase NamZ domain-containing protein [Blastocatellia bacterium]|nr:exo-beta-N-acetylmuramidase NamZ domain-containing protein [Blastocatellia bacterium]
MHGAFGLYKHFTLTGFVLVPLRFYKHFIPTGLKVATTLLVVASITFGSISAQRTLIASHKLVEAKPEAVGMSSERLAKIDEAVLESISRKETPGAVVLVARKGRVVYRKAFGDRAIEPRRETMTIDTIFDLASLTKIVATATSMMILVERGKVSLADPVALYIPEFGKFGKERITVEQLMTHRAGLPPDNEIADYVGKTIDPMQQIYDLRPSYEPGTRFVYSDVGFIVAAEIVRRVSGDRIDEFSRKNIFDCLGMMDTNFSSKFAGLEIVRKGLRGTISWVTTDPYRERQLSEKEMKPYRTSADLIEARLKRIAPTENREGRWMRGEVHDPRAYEMGGVAGHAGLFSTADDLAIFCQMILNKGEYNGVRILAPYSVERMVSAQSLPTSQMRGIGWDINTSYSSNRGDLFPVGTFGHTGFTGTSLWLDPASETFVILLTNRVHPNGKGDVTRLRSFVASIVAGAISESPHAPVFEHLKSPPTYVDAPRAVVTRSVPSGPLHPVLTGIDVLERDGFKQLEGRRVGLITNHTGRDGKGRSTIDVLAAAKNLKLVALFSPEHGLRGIEDTHVGDTRDDKTGLPVYSLYEKDRRRPTAEMLKGIDTLMFDIQDVGARFYTYTTTCGYALEEAAKNKIKFVVLDRPDPINGYEIEGPVTDSEFTNQFISYHSVPVRYGMTIGELAMLFNSERKINADLTVIKMEGWRRADYYDGTALTWVNPSPNMRNLTEALLYPGIGLLETTNLSVGRGTDTPFEVIGAPWVDGSKLAEALNRAGHAGVRFVPVRFTPKSSKFANEECGGVNIVVTDRGSFHPVATGIEIAYQLNRLHPGVWKLDDYLRLLVNRAALAALKQGKTPSEIATTWQTGLAEFASIRKKYLIY